MRKLLVKTALAVCLLTACGDPGDKRERMVKEFDRTDTDITVSLTIVKTEKDMRKKAINYKEGLAGEAAWTLTGSHCDIVIYEPKYVDDDAIVTLGHELAHCFWGLYHK